MALDVPKCNHMMTLGFKGLTSLKVTNFGNDQKPVCDVLVVNRPNTNLCDISHRFRVIAVF